MDHDKLKGRSSTCLNVLRSIPHKSSYTDHNLSCIEMGSRASFTPAHRACGIYTNSYTYRHIYMCLRIRDLTRDVYTPVQFTRHLFIGAVLSLWILVGTSAKVYGHRPRGYSDSLFRECFSLRLHTNIVVWSELILMTGPCR